MKKRYLAFTLLGIGAMVASFGTTFALFQHTKQVADSNLIQSEGRRNTQIFLGRLGSSHWTDVAGISIWMCKWNSNNDNYYAWEKQQASTVIASDGHSYLLFDLDTTLYNSFSFHRIPDTTAEDKTVNGVVAFTASDRNKNNTNSSGEFFNATYVLGKLPGKNCYTITSSESGGNLGFLSAGKWDDVELHYTGEYTPIEYAHSPEFDDNYYVVGSGNYSTGVSSYGYSWYDMSEGKIMSLNTDNVGDQENVDKQYKAQITFTGNDTVRIRSTNWPRVIYETSVGALDSEDVILVDGGNNMHIKTTGTYNFYFKVVKVSNIVSYRVCVTAEPEP